MVNWGVGMRVVVGVVVVLSIVLTGCNSVPEELYCESNTDCVPDVCCHANGAVNKDHGPDCSATLCSASCEPGTLDCGNGELRCVENRCEAVIYE